MLAIPIEVELVDVSGAVTVEVDFMGFPLGTGVVPGVEDARDMVSLAPVTTVTGVERATGTTSPF